MIRSLFKQKPPSAIDDAIERTLVVMNEEEIDSEEYAKAIAYLERLSKLKNANRSGKPSPDTVLTVAGNVLIVGIIVAYEHGHVIVSKGLGLLLKTPLVK